MEKMTQRKKNKKARGKSAEKALLPYIQSITRRLNSSVQKYFEAGPTGGTRLLLLPNASMPGLNGADDPRVLPLKHEQRPTLGGEGASHLSARP